jgi:hypothetical protein
LDNGRIIKNWLQNSTSFCCYFDHKMLCNDHRPPRSRAGRP